MRTGIGNFFCATPTHRTVSLHHYHREVKRPAFPPDEFCCAERRGVWDGNTSSGTPLPSVLQQKFFCGSLFSLCIQIVPSCPLCIQLVLRYERTRALLWPHPPGSRDQYLASKWPLFPMGNKKWIEWAMA